ncbi:MAG: response regulator [candidate division Zixibacteria bacterium]|jgi:DNA-binding response OmpR family regulator|nr:response regulator [candidate division Zixibacteria bacterium]
MTQAAKTGSKVKAAKILVIDDEPEITQIIEAFLDNAGHKITTENSSVMGIERAKELKPDLILLDIMMPNMDGYEICDELKKSDETSDIPIIFLTGKDSRDDKGRSFQVGGDMFVKKPFSCERLLEIVNIVLQSAAK